MALAVDAAGKKKASPTTGKVMRANQKKSYGDIVQTASMPTRTSFSGEAFSPNAINTLVRTSGMSSPRQIKSSVASRPSSLRPTTTAPKANVTKPASLNDGDDTRLEALANGIRPMTDGTQPKGTQSIDISKLDPMMEGVRERLGNTITKPSMAQTSLPVLATGVAPTVDPNAIKPSEPKKLPSLPDFSPAADNIRDYLVDNVFSNPNYGKDAVNLTQTSGGATPMMRRDDVGPNDSPIEFDMPSVDGIRDRLAEMVTKVPDDESATRMPAVASGAQPIASSDVLESDSDGISLGDLLADQMTEYIGDNETNEAYLQDAIANGMSEEDAEAIRGRADASWWQQLGKALGQPLAGYDNTTDNRETLGDVTVMDDGTAYDYNHMTADTMTGTQYLHYAEMGMGGRPVEQIDPTKTYSKRREHINYGFVPFVPDETAYANMIASNVMAAPSRAGMWVANMREHLTPDYTIGYGDGNVISGRDYDRLSEPYMHQFQYYERFDPERYLTEHENSTALVREYEMPSVDGDTTYHYGGIATDEGGTRIFRNQDGTYDIEFTDGSVATVPQSYMDSVMADGGVIRDSGRIPVSEARGKVPNNLSSLNDMDKINAMVEEYGGSPLDYADVLYLPDLILSDGTRMTYSDVDRIYHDQTPENDAEDPYDNDIEYGFREGLLPVLNGSVLPGASNKPKRLMAQEMFGDGGIDLSDIGSNAWDWTFGSLPISIGSTIPWIYSASGATASLAGSDPGTYDVNDDSYSMIAGDYDKNGNMRYGVTDVDGNLDPRLSQSTKLWNTAGNAAVPLTEMMVGPVGEQIVPLERIFGELPANPTVAQVIKNTLIGAAGEGVEEDLGNIFDEITQYGPAGMFSNQAVDGNGNPIYDTSGHEIRDYGTKLGDRFANAINANDLANSFAGGVTVDLLMDALLSPFNGKSFTRQIGPAVRRDMARRKTGVNQYVETERERAIREALENGEEPPELEWQQVPDSYLAGFSGIDREVR